MVFDFSNIRPRGPAINGGAGATEFVSTFPRRCDTMGYMVHHAIIVTSEYEVKITTAHYHAETLFENVSDIIPGTANNSSSFLIPPDGSKEGWFASDDGDERRQKFVEYLRSQNGLSWVEVQFGDDEGDNCVIQSDTDYDWSEGPYEPPQLVRVRRRMIDLG